MESNTKPYPIQQILILQLNDYQKASRLWFLFNQKILDLFIGQCQLLEKFGINLSALGKLTTSSKDLKVQYLSMRRAYEITKQLMDIAKSSDSEWRQITLDDDSSVQIKTNKTMLTLKANGVAKINLKHLCYATYLIKHYTQCVPFCKQAKDILEPSRLQKVAFLRLSIPVPFIKDRSCLVRGVGFRLSQRPKNICIFAEGINSQKQYLNKVKVDLTEYMQGRQLFDLKHCAMQIRRLSPQQIEYSAAAIVDHHVPFVPDAIIIFVVKQFLKFVVNNLMSKLRNFQQSIWGKQLKQNYKQNIQFYQWLDEVVKGFQSKK